MAGSDLLPEYPDMGESMTKIRVLLDLKPAFDGYGGIPQETRLLFNGLLSMADAFDVEGLIQHGARRLKPGLPSRRASRLPTQRQVNRLSRMVVSVYKDPYGTWWEQTNDWIDRYFSLTGLRLRVMAGVSIKPTVFESELFDDFTWRTFFSKTLRPEDKPLVSGARFRILRASKKVFHKAGLAGLRMSQSPRYPSIDTRGFDYFIAETPYPARVSRGTQLLVRYHDAVPVLMPHTIDDKPFHQASHFYALQDNVQSGAKFACVSEATRTDLLKIFPQLEGRATVIHNIVSGEYFEENSPRRLIYQIIRTRLGDAGEFGTELGGLTFDASQQRGRDFQYLLMVSTLEPRKNHLLFLHAWERLKYTTMPKLKLVVVGNKGWDCKPILQAFRPWAERGDLYYLNNVPSDELRVLYRHAAATVCPSLAEGFDYSGIEAMASGGIVISSDIPVHREVFQDASAYFNPYSQDDAAAVMQQVLGPGNSGWRQALLAAGSRVASRYTYEAILPRWRSLLLEGKKG